MNYRAIRCYQNLEKRLYKGEGKYNVPYINPVNIDVSDTPMISFNYAMTEKHPENKICHFFVDDYQFERIWYRPDTYVELLKKFKAVISPDFSIYTDFPDAVRIFNHYRTQWLGAYLQENGVTVIPDVSWSDESTYDWVFDGIPKHALVCMSTVGCWGNYGNPKGFVDGFNKAMEVLQPSHVLLYGKDYPEIKFTCPYTVAKNQNIASWEERKQKKAQEEKEKQKMLPHTDL